MPQVGESELLFQKRAEDLDARIDSATTSIRAEKDAAESLAASRATEITTLTSTLETVRAESENRYRIGINWRGRATKLGEEKTALSESIVAKDKEIEEINGNIASLNGEIETTKARIVDVEKKLADSERGSQLKDGTVQRLQSELAKAQGQGQNGTAVTDTAAMVSPTSAEARC